MKAAAYRIFYFVWCCVPPGVFVLTLGLPLAIFILHHYGAGLDIPSWLGLNRITGAIPRTKYMW